MSEYKLPYTGAQIAQKLGKVDTLETQISQLSSEIDDHEARILALENGTTAIHTNQILNSINSDGTPYNGGTGYKEGYRLNSSGVEAAASDHVISGYIPYNGEAVELRVPNTADVSAYGGSSTYIHVYDSSYNLIKFTNSVGTSDGSTHQVYWWVTEFGATYSFRNGTTKIIIPKGNKYMNGVAYIRISARVDVELSPSTFDLALDENLDNGNSDNGGGTNTTDDSVPSYWLTELETKANTIQLAMESAGRNKSAFLWYTDAHWQSSSKMSPVLLKYLIQHTPINKVNFGGDVVNDPSPYSHDNIKYVYDWRAAISDLPNHHSVFGNHDVNHRTTDVHNTAYAVVLAPEETPYMVVGGDSYYYIDYPSEKTRYLYLSYMTNDHTEMMAEGQFIVDSLMSTPEGWHVVAIAHRWWQYSASDTPTIGAVPNFEKDILSVFDAYNARTTRSASNYFYTQDFTNGKGRVEFCIGGHIHVDHDFTSDGGIPVIITAADTQQERVPDDSDDCGESGTTTESAVFGIIADYTDSTTTKITVVGVGRGTSRVINGGTVEPDEPDEPDEPVAAKNEIWTSKAADGVSTYVSADGSTTGYAVGKRLNSSGVEKDLANCAVTGFIPYNGEDIEVTIPNTSESNSYNYIHTYVWYEGSIQALNHDPSGTTITGDNRQVHLWVSNGWATRTFNETTQTIHIPASSILAADNIQYIRVSAPIENNNTINDSTFSVKLLNGEGAATNLFDKNDPNVLDTGRFNSSMNAVAYATGQLCTGYIDGKLGDVFTVSSDKANNTNNYTGTVMCYDADKNPIDALTNQHTHNNVVVLSDGYKTVTFTIPASYPGQETDYSKTVFVRFCIAYTDIDSIVITKR